MAETKTDATIQKGPPLYSHGETKPKVEEGYDYIPEYHVQNRDQIIGWRRIGTTGHSDSEGFLVPPEAGGSETQTFRQGTLREARDGQESQGEK